jgi:hypothetical protein
MSLPAVTTQHSDPAVVSLSDAHTVPSYAGVPRPYVGAPSVRGDGNGWR